MTAYDYDRDHKAFVKTCKCGHIAVGTEDQGESVMIFLETFEHDTQTSDGLRALCRECTANVRAKNRGVEPHNRRELLAAQNGKCAICLEDIEFNSKGSMHSAHVDHDHSTGKVRGILCAHCNRALGLFKNDTRTILRAAVYLENSK